jgi:hypothetical protein
MVFDDEEKLWADLAARKAQAATKVIPLVAPQLS